MNLTVEQYQDFLTQRFGGVVAKGKHAPDGEACINESYAAYLGIGWTDSPTLLGLPDFRPLNDAPWSTDAARTEAMVRLLVAYQGWATWTPARRQAVAERLALLTVQRLIADLPELPEDVAHQCRQVRTLAEAQAAGRAAEAAGETVLLRAVTLWEEAAA